jgi:hypothetical protein
MILTIAIAAVALAFLLGVAVAATLSERALRPSLVPARASRQIKVR